MASRLSTILLAVAAYGMVPLSHATPQCMPVAGWSEPGGAPLSADALLDGLSDRSIVMLGERHDAAHHHRWQLETLRRLHERRPDIVLAAEMFPRRVQSALDAWTNGELDEQAFLERSDWYSVWRFDPELYMPIFRYVRDHGIPVRALNIEASLTRSVGRGGFDAMAPSELEGISRPAEPDPRYVKWLTEIHERHHPPTRISDDAGAHALRNFIDAQLLWDRAFAQGLAEANRSYPRALIVALIGSGHLMHGHGVAHQLNDLGVGGHATLLPWDADSGCSQLEGGLAHAIFGFNSDAPDNTP